MKKYIRTFIIANIVVLITACSGSSGSSGGGSNNNANKSNTETYSIDGNYIDSIDALHTIGDASITMAHNSATPLIIQSIQLDNELDTVKSSSTCLNNTLKQNTTCNIDLDIQGVYTAKTNITMTINTNLGVKQIILPIFNYNYTNNITDTSKKLQFSFNEQIADTNQSLIISSIGDQVITVRNVESSPIYLNLIEFTSSKITGDDDKEYYMDNIVESSSTCNGTLLSNQTCLIHIDFEGLNSTDKLTVSYQDGQPQTANIFNNSQLEFFDHIFTAQCTGLGTCQINSKQIQNHKILLNSYSIGSNLAGANITGATISTSATNGCLLGRDLSKYGFCNLDIVATTLPVVGGASINMYAKYYINESAGINFYKGVDGDINIITGQIEQPSFTTNGDYPTGYMDAENVWHGIGNQLLIYNDSGNNMSNPLPMTIKRIWVEVGSTNYVNYLTEELIQAESIVMQDDCIGQTLQPHTSHCRLLITAGSQAWGTVGKLFVEYSIGDDTTLYKISTQLANVMQPISLVVAGDSSQSDDIINFWTYGQDSNKEFHITTNNTNMSGGLVIYNNSSENVGTYLTLSNNYDKYYIFGIPDCKSIYPTGWMNSGISYQYCGYDFDFSSTNAGDSIPFTLTVGNHAETTLNIVFDIINATTKKTITYKGAIK